MVRNHLFPFILWTAGLIFAAFLISAAGCRPESEHGHEDASTRLRIGTPMKIRQTNPLADYGYSILAMLTTHETLVRFNADLEPVPQLAASWNVSTDATRWTFFLVENALWHDGRPVTAEDVKFTFEYMGATHPASAWIRDLISRIETDGHEITFFLKRPYSRFLINVGFIVRILPRHIWLSVKNPLTPGRMDAAMGCGPYILEAFDVRENRIRFRKNGSYYGPPPAVQALDFLTHLTFDNLTLLLLNKDVDIFYKYASGYPPPYLPRLKTDPGLQILYGDGIGIPAALGFTLKQGPTADQGFRNALVSAFDYEKLTRSLLADSGKIPSAGFAPPALKQGTEHRPLLEFSQDRSRKKLLESGYQDTDNDGWINDPATGKNLVLRLLARSDLEGMDGILPILSHNLRQIGILLEMEKADLSTWITRIRQQDHDLILFRTTPWGMLMDAGCGTGYFDSRRSGGGTLANVTDPAFHNLCDRVLESTDPDEQMRLYTKIRNYYADHLPAVALCWTVNAYPFSGRMNLPVINPVEGGIVNREILCSLQKVFGE